MITYGEIEGKVLRILNKTSTNRGFYTAEKCMDAITESVDSIAADMMIADQGWLTKIAYLNTAIGTVTVPIPPYIHMVKEVRYLDGNIYVRINYDDGTDQDRWTLESGVSSFPNAYQVIDNQFFFNPPLGSGGDKYLMVEYMSYPRVPQDSVDVFEQQFDNAMFHLIKYMAASILGMSFGKYQSEWGVQQAMWAGKVTTLLNRRNLQSTTLREFNG